MSRLPQVAARVVILASAFLFPFLGACTAILGIDEPLTQGDAGDASGGGSDASDGVDGGPGRPDATVPDGAVTASDASAPVWHVDLGFGEGGYELLGASAADVTASGLQLLDRPDAAPLIVGTTANGALTVYSAFDVTTPLSTLPEAQTDAVFGGATLADGGGLLAVTVDGNAGVFLHVINPDLQSERSYNPPSPTEASFTRLLGQTGDGGVHAIGFVGSFFDAPEAADLVVTKTLASSTPLPSNTLVPMSLVKAEMTTADGTTYAGGYVDQNGGISAVYSAVSPDGVVHGGTVAAPGTDGSGITDFVVIGQQVFALGFADGSFLLAPLPPPGSDAGVTAHLIPTANTRGFLLATDEELPESVQLLAAVDPQQRILVGGNFDGVTLAAFRTDGAADQTAFAAAAIPGGADAYGAVVDLAPYLPPLPSDNYWVFQSMLLQGTTLYVTASTYSDGDDAAWALLRLVYSPVDR
jgi:hypothetical protein